MATVTKKDLIDRIAVKANCKQVDAKRIVQLLLDEIIEDLANGHRLEFRDFGVLQTKDRSARVAQNPKTLERVQVPPKRTVKFKVGRLLKQRLDAWAIENQQTSGGASASAVKPKTTAKSAGASARAPHATTEIVVRSSAAGTRDGSGKPQSIAAENSGG